MYRWVPAHAIPDCTDINICVTYECNRSFTATLEGKCSNGHARSIIRLPDRTLIVFTQDKYRPQNTSFDHHFHFGLFGDNFNSIGLGLIAAEFRNEVPYIDIPKSQMLIADSGGFQLRAGKISYIDPYSIIDWMNRNATVGIGLDVCPRGIPFETPEVKACISASRQNNRIFIEYGKKTLKLLNVLHGDNQKNIHRWIDGLENDRFNGWAVGTDAQLLSSFHALLAARNLHPKPHYHLFAIGSTTNVFALGWIGKYVDLLTSDSTTYRNSGMSREMQILMPNGMVKRIFVGKLRPFSKTFVPSSPCICPICSIVRSLDVYGLDSKFKTERLLTWHNMFTIHRQAQYWNGLAQQLAIEEYIESIVRTVRQSSHRNSLIDKALLHVRFIEEFVQGGEEAARKKYSSELEKVRVQSLKDDEFVSDYCEGEYLRFKKRGLKSAKIAEGHISIAVDTLPFYFSPDALTKFGIDQEEYLYESSQYRMRRAKLTRKLEAKGKLETLAHSAFRKFPGKILKLHRKAGIR